MRSTRTIRRTAIALTALAVGTAILAAPALVGAPAPAAVSASRASVVLVDRLEGIPSAARVQSPRAIVIRRSGGPAPHNIILVTRETQPDDLDKAVSQLMVSLRRAPKIERAEIRAFVSAAGRHPSAGRDRARAANDLRRLATAGEYDIAGVGKRKAITIRMKAPKPETKPKRAKP